MSNPPYLHLIAGPNGAGKTTFYNLRFSTTPLPFINADRLAAEHWAGNEEPNSYAAAELATRTRTQLIQQQKSFITETVFSHPSKIELVETANRHGYNTVLYVIAIPEQLAVIRTQDRANWGGHSVPEHKVRARYHRLWKHVSVAAQKTFRAYLYDNTSPQQPFRLTGELHHGTLVHNPTWPPWYPPELISQTQTPTSYRP